MTTALLPVPEPGPWRCEPIPCALTAVPELRTTRDSLLPQLSAWLTSSARAAVKKLPALSDMAVFTVPEAVNAKVNRIPHTTSQPARAACR